MKWSISTGIRNMVLLSFITCITVNASGWKSSSVRTDSVPVNLNDTSRNLPTHPDHIVFLWLENKDFDTIIGNRYAPFINELVSRGTLFTNTYAITHPSYPNYVDFFAGAPNGIIDDACIDHAILATPNLYTVLKDAGGRSFAWYSEGLPRTGSKACQYNYYAAKHNPTTIFANVPAKANKRFADFPSDYTQLENVVCISPNLVNDMHSGSIKQGDDWIKKHLESLVTWCTSHNSIFVIFFDESESYRDNRIPVIAVGEHVKTDYQSDTRYDDYSWTKTICAMFLAKDAWTDNLGAAKIITECWK